MRRSRVRRRLVALLGLAAAMACPAGASAQIDMRDEVVYHFMPIAWRDSDLDTNRYGDFGGMEASLDYLEGLGVTAVWMNPIFPSPAYHGYQHGRGDELNPWFGTEAAWVSFVEAAHARGIRVFVDFVVYGISHDSPWFGSAFGNPGSPYDDWLAFVNGANTQYLGAVFNTWNGDSVGFIHWDLREPDVFDMVADWGKKWLDPNGDGDFSDGVDGYRLDHVWAQYPSGPDGWGYNIDDFWEPWKAELQSVNPDVFIFAEQADWGSMGTELLTAFDASMTKPFEFAARSAIASGDASGLYSSMAAAWASVPGGRTFMAIVGDHDVDRLASVVGPEFSKSRVAAAVLMLQPFPPMIYFGDEIGMLGVKGNYGSDANDIPFREPFKWNAVAGSPMSNYWIENNQAFNNAYSANNDGRSVEEQDGVAGSILETNRALIAARTGSVALRRGTYIPVPASDSAVWAFVRQHADQDVLCVINVGDSDLDVDLDLSAFEITGGITQPVDLLSGWAPREIEGANQSAWPMAILANTFYAFEVELETYAPPVGGVSGQDLPARMGAPALRATQDTPTSLGDNITELDEMYASLEGDALRIGLTGNLATDGTGLCVFLDTGAPGQSVLDFTSGHSPPPSGPGGLTGLEMDAGFEPEVMLFVNAFGGTVYVDWFELLSSGGVDKTYRGQGTVNSGFGTLSGGSNPGGLEVAMDNTNTAGVTGSSAAGASTAVSGFEALVPLADLGLSPARMSGEVRVMAMAIRTSGVVSSQVLPPVGGSGSDVGLAPDFGSIPGDQYTTVAPAPPVECAADIDGDGDTDVFDFNVFAPAFGTSLGDPGYVAAADLDGSETIDVFDFNLFAPDFGCTE